MNPTSLLIPSDSRNDFRFKPRQTTSSCVKTPLVPTPPVTPFITGRQTEGKISSSARLKEAVTEVFCFESYRLLIILVFRLSTYYGVSCTRKRGVSPPGVRSSVRRSPTKNVATLSAVDVSEVDPDVFVRWWGGTEGRRLGDLTCISVNIDFTPVYSIGFNNG